MPSRSLLRNQLLRAWHETINGEYSKQLINSERGLQVYFCNHLLNEFKQSGVDRRLFIEPSVSTPADGQALYPDIVICNSRIIIGVVEIKYQPRVRPRYAKDLNTLAWVLDNANEIHLSNDRYRGERETSSQYRLAPDAVLCWGGVYTAPQAEIQLPESHPINSRVMVLHALTQAGRRAVPLPALPNSADFSISLEGDGDSAHLRVVAF